MFRYILLFVGDTYLYLILVLRAFCRSAVESVIPVGSQPKLDSVLILDFLSLVYQDTALPLLETSPHLDSVLHLEKYLQVSQV